ncbi:hypothetical protein [Shewanella dokdonensis]|uniref:Lipoprotein n=1 Tax=Shewanella dokdonensis TaxID=712036 RepID=A0ABX8DEQ4_9GAMM|nr:hypothetical protein [Shewanella dokdonensis]MCL1074737.1 hypothetical protein [Shewanella dokdonensis]QVK22282.1 hypothetical protein KHX94_12760 [Shewanella dokdonensis]
MALSKIWVALSSLTVALVMVGCDDNVQTQNKFSATEICKATMATALQHDVSTISLVDKNGKLVYVSYTDPTDSSQNIYRCRLDGDHVLWAPNKGQWQNQTEGQISFIANYNQLTITETSGNGQQHTNQYKLSELKSS